MLYRKLGVAVLAALVVMPASAGAQRPDELPAGSQADISSSVTTSNDAGDPASSSTATPPVSPSKPPPTIIALFGGETVSAAQARRLIGEPEFELLNCQEPSHFSGPDERHVRVKVERVPASGIMAHGPVVDALLLRAAQFAWRKCPQPFMFLDTPRDDFHYDVGIVEITGPDGQQLVLAKLGGKALTSWGDQPLGSSKKGYQWLDVRDVAAEYAAAAQQAEDVARDQAARSAQGRQRTTESAGSNSSFLVLLFFGAALWIVIKREALSEWFYSLRPHPATQLVDAAIYHGQPIDGALYEQIHRPRFGNRIENAVRERQADDLTARLRKHEAALHAAEARFAQLARERAERDNSFLRAHAELLRAGVDHEYAAARLDEWRKMSNEQ